MIDTDSDPGSYAFALRAPPWIEDRDGFTFYNGAFLSPDAGFERLSDAGERSGDAAPFANVPFHHDNPNSPEAKQDHA